MRGLSVSKEVSSGAFRNTNCLLTGNREQVFFLPSVQD